MTGLRYGSVCSGIEAATVAWHPLGWQPQFFSEIEAAPRAVLSHHYPQVPLHGDFTTIQEGQYGAIDLLVGGTPCQSFSVAGLRGGLADDRGNLALQYLRLAQRLRPRWLVWENVPGVLSSSGGRDFGAILGGMVELGYGFAYRVLDAQYVRVDGYGRAVPQRRRRVFVVGHLGDWRRPAAVLLERASLRGDPAPRREAGEGTARCLTRGSGGGQRYDWETETFVAGCLNGHSEYGADIPTPRAEGGDAAGGSEALLAYAVTQDSTPLCEHELSPALKVGTGLAMGQPPAVAFNWQAGGDETTSLKAYDYSPTLTKNQLPAVAQPLAFQVSESGVRVGDVHATLDANNGPRRHNGVFSGWSVRRLTPTECERLQGFPDGQTLVPWRGGLMPDGPRYKMLGNSMACNVMRWIGRRIEMVENQK